MLEIFSTLPDNNDEDCVSPDILHPEQICDAGTRVNIRRRFCRVRLMWDLHEGRQPSPVDFAHFVNSLHGLFSSALALQPGQGLGNVPR